VHGELSLLPRDSARAGWELRRDPPDVLVVIPHAALHDVPLHLVELEGGVPLGSVTGVSYASSRTQVTWLSRHLGHSSLKVTTDIYGHWERAERKLQAAKMEGAFPV
jgi:hypothetical protein